MVSYLNYLSHPKQDKKYFLIVILISMSAKSIQSCLTLFDHMDSSLPNSSVHGISQARILE